MEPQVRLDVANSYPGWHPIGALPDLSNVHFLERGLNWSTLAYVIFVCLAAATSFLLALFAGRVTAAKDHELKRLESSSAEAVARAHAGAARANAQAEVAYKEKRRLEADIAHAQAHHEQLRKENLRLQLAVEKERIARLRLEEKFGARHIGTAQVQSIESSLSGFNGQNVAIVIPPGDAEIAAFARELKDALEGAGLAVAFTTELAGKPDPGLTMEIGANRRQFATALAKALMNAGVCSGPISAAEPPDVDLLEIAIGPKP